MSLNESIIEDAALEWFGELVPQSREVGHGAAFAGLRRAKPHLAPGEPVAERDSFGEVVQFRFTQTLTPALSQKERERRESIRRLNPTIPEEARATIKRYLRVRLERRPNP